MTTPIYDSFDSDPVVAGNPLVSGGFTLYAASARDSVAAGGEGTSALNPLIAQAYEGKKAGKWIVGFEYGFAPVGGSDSVGVVSSSGIGAGGSLGGNAYTSPSNFGGIAYRADGTVYIYGSSQSLYATVPWPLGAEVNVALDLDNGRVWFTPDGGANWVGLPGHGVPSPANLPSGFDISGPMGFHERIYPCVCVTTPYSVLVANFSGSQNVSVSGFTPGWTNTVPARRVFGSFGASGNCQGTVPGPPQGTCMVSPYQSTFTGQLGSVVLMHSSRPGTMRAVVYDDSGPAQGPGQLLGYSDTRVDVTDTSITAGERAYGFSDVYLVSGQTYWIGMISPSQVVTNGGNTITSCPALSNGAAYYDVRSLGPYNQFTPPDPCIPDQAFSSSPTYANFRIPLLAYQGSTASASGASSARASSSLITSSRMVCAAGAKARATSSLGLCPWPPDRGDSYTAVESAEVTKQFGTDGGQPRTRLDHLVPATWQVGVQWTVGPSQFDALWGFYEGALANGASPFVVYLMLGYGYPTPCVANFVPGTMTTTSVDGKTFVVQATLEATDPTATVANDTAILALVDLYGDPEVAATYDPVLFLGVPD